MQNLFYVVLVSCALLAFSSARAQQELPPPGSGEERVVFRTALTPVERQFAETSAAVFGWRGEVRAATKEGKLYWAEIDLDADGKNERVLLLNGPGACGSIGCPTLILTAPRGKWRLLGDISAEPGYLFALYKTDYGWRRLRYAVQENYWTGCEFWNDAFPEQSEGGPNPCSKIHYGAGVSVKDKKRAAK
jgi:hypothetical protein